jgi:NAD(P)-dependent dehydrogenase (short-subunit alcohol dehydrogenase family)
MVSCNSPRASAQLDGFQVAFGAVEALRRSLACELGPHGIRVLTLQTGSVPKSLPEAIDGAQRKVIAEDIAGRTMLKRAAPLEDVGNVAAFAASDQAGALPATALNLAAGSVVDRLQARKSMVRADPEASAAW